MKLSASPSPAAARTPQVILVVARADNGVIGRGGALPWHIPADLRHFKQVTTGTPMIMGRKTFESLPGLLPHRRHIVLTRDPRWSAEGAEVARTPKDALALAGEERITVIGGAEIFELFMPLATAIELTEVKAEIEGDTTMSAPSSELWREVSREDHEPEQDRPAFSFVRLERRAS